MGRFDRVKETFERATARSKGTYHGTSTEANLEAAANGFWVVARASLGTSNPSMPSVLLRQGRGQPALRWVYEVSYPAIGLDLQVETRPALRMFLLRTLRKLSASSYVRLDDAALDRRCAVRGSDPDRVRAALRGCRKQLLDVLDAYRTVELNDRMIRVSGESGWSFPPDEVDRSIRRVTELAQALTS